MSTPPNDKSATRKLRRAALGTLAGGIAVAAGIAWQIKNSEKEEKKIAAEKAEEALARAKVEPPTSTMSPQQAVAALFAVSMNDANGKHVALNKFKGKPVVVNFWATWCPPCVEEMPELSDWQKEVGEKVAIVGIAIDSPANVREFALKKQFHHLLLNGGLAGTDLSKALGNPTDALPFTVVISPKEEIAYKILGRFALENLKLAATV